MIETVEKALIVWGEQYRRAGTVASIKCPLGAAIDNQGVMVRGTGPGALGTELYRGELGQVGEAVERALVMVRGRQPLRCAGVSVTGAELVRIARVRYLTDPMPLEEHQARRMRWSVKVYRHRLHLLHTHLEPLLLAELPWLRRVG